MMKTTLFSVAYYVKNTTDLWEIKCHIPLSLPLTPATTTTATTPITYTLFTDILDDQIHIILFITPDVNLVERFNSK